MYTSDEFEEASDYYSIVNSSDDENGAEPIIEEDGDEPIIADDGDEPIIAEDGDEPIVEDDDEDEEEVIEISSSTHGVDRPAQSAQGPMMRFTVPGHVGAQNVEVSVVSLARYTFADPELAAEGPEPLEPPLQTMRIGHDDGGRAVSIRRTEGVARMRGADAAAFGTYDDEGLIAEFTEERSNRRLAQIARRLLLPDS
ncbi:hypothetical protein IWW50_000597, partial [Coemansia erecta]